MRKSERKELVQRTEYFGGRIDIFSDDSYAVEAVRKGHYTLSLETVVHTLYHRVGQNAYLLSSP